MAGKFKDIWNRKKDGAYGEQRSFLRFFIVATAFFAVVMFVKRDNIIRWCQAGFTIRDQKRQIEHLETTIKGMNEHIEMLTTNKDSLETFAREKFHFAEPGDDVFLTDK